LVDGSIALEEIVLDGAKSSLVYSTASNVSNPVRTAWISLLNQSLKGVAPDHGRRQLEAIYAVTVDDVKATLKKYILPIFEPSTSFAVVASSPAKAEETKEQLRKAGFDVESKVMDTAAGLLETVLGVRNIAKTFFSTHRDIRSWSFLSCWTELIKPIARLSFILVKTQIGLLRNISLLPWSE